MRQLKLLKHLSSYEANIMESIGYFFSRIFTRLGYTISNAAESKIRDTVEKPLERSLNSSYQKDADRQDRNR
jgi:hypothetical protein